MTGVQTCALPIFSYLDKRQDKLRTEAAEASTGTGTGSAGPTWHPTEEMDVDSNGNQPLGVGGDAEGGKDGKEGKIMVKIHRRNVTD